jgi:hypothetical protein
MQDNNTDKYQQISSHERYIQSVFLSLIAADGGSASHGLTGVRPYITNSRKVSFIAFREDCVPFVLNHLATIEVVIAGLDLPGGSILHKALVLYFTRHQVFFRCVYATFNEEAWEAGASAISGGRMHVLFESDALTLLRWRKGVKEYSNQNSKYPDDRLKTFRGILTNIQNAPVDAFMLRFYSEAYRDGLLWKHNDCSRSKRLSIYPSSSWYERIGPCTISNSGIDLCANNGIRHRATSMEMSPKAGQHTVLSIIIWSIWCSVYLTRRTPRRYQSSIDAIVLSFVGYPAVFKSISSSQVKMAHCKVSVTLK